MKKRALVWFKTDLRLHDNEVLTQALMHADEIIPVYCLDESLYGITSFGFQKTGAFRFTFLWESLLDLHQQLQNKGSSLIVVKGKPERVIPELARQWEVTKVYTKKEVAHEERLSMERVEKELWKSLCPLETFSTSTLYHALDLPYALKDIPDVFTTFRKKTEKESEVRPVFATPERIPSPVLEQSFPRAEEMGIRLKKTDQRAVYVFKGGESAGLERLNDYLYGSHAINTYKETRNGMLEPNDSSRLSPWLSMGCLSPRQIYHAIKKYEDEFGANDSTYWLIFELIWRDYFRFMMKKHHNRYFMQSGLRADTVLNGHREEEFRKWVEAKTGNDFIDANMLELKLTGYMSNRGRQNVASYLCHDLKGDWRYGAAYFEQQLIDYDVCSNWGNWAYLAGVGNDPRGVRQFNTQKQADEYDKHGTYRQRWLVNTKTEK